MIDDSTPIQIVDVETYSNFWMLGAQDFRTGDTLQWSTEPGIGGTLAEARDWYHEHKHSTLFIGFNNIAYDNTMIRAVLIEGIEDCAELYKLSQKTIATKRNRQDQIASETSIDIYAMHGGQNSKVGSLKECGVKLDYPVLQELPYHFATTLTHDQMVEVAAYNLHDLAITARTTAVSMDAILARWAVAEEYGLLSIINAHDARIVIDILAVEMYPDNKLPWPKATDWLCRGQQFTSRFHYDHPELIALLDRISKWSMGFHLESFTKPDGDAEKSIKGEAFSDTVTVDDVHYRIGSGGLHTADEPGIWEADENYRIIDFDVSSFYPALIINHRFSPSHLPHAKFSQSFTAVRDHRLAAKAARQDALSNGLKIGINSVFGKFKSPYAWIVDPVMSIGVTITGQLTLLTFVDMLSGIDGLCVVSGNTDGLTIRVRRDIADEVIRAMHALAAHHDLNLDQVDYQRICRADISSYIAIKLDGSIKAKGRFTYDKMNLGKKATNRIVIDAAQQFFLHGTPVADTIRACDDIRMFVDYFKATKAYEIIDDRGGHYGGIARWYLSTDGVRLDKRRISDGQLTKLVGAGAKVIANLPSEMPSDVAYEAYEVMAENLVRAITEPGVRASQTIPLAELNRAQADRHRHNMETGDADLDRCKAVDLSRYYEDYADLPRGNPFDTMNSLAARLWLSNKGELTKGDLYWLCQEIDASAGKFSAGSGARKLAGMVDWVAREVSPFPLPQTTEEYVARAMTWAQEKVEPYKRKRQLYHRDMCDSLYVTGDALRKYGKKRDEYILACSICAIGVKHDALPDHARIVAMVQEIKAHFEQDIS